MNHTVMNIINKTKICWKLVKVFSEQLKVKKKKKYKMDIVG